MKMGTATNSMSDKGIATEIRLELVAVPIFEDKA